MIDKSRLDLGIGSRGTPGKTVLVKSSSQADLAILRDTYEETEDPINGDTLVFATIDAAIGAFDSLGASLGGTILVSAGHTETVSAAGGFDVDNAGLTIKGLGVGDNRPAITFDTDTAASVDFGASNLLIENLVFINDIDALAEPLDIEATFDNITFKNCEFRDDTASKQTVRWFQTAATNDSIKVIDCKHVGSDTAGATAFCTLIGGKKHVIKGLVSNGDFSAGNIEIKTTLTNDLLIDDCVLENANAVDVNIEGNSLESTGWIRNTHCRLATDGQTTWINNVGELTFYECYGADNGEESGTKIGTASSGSVEDDVAAILVDTGTTIPALHAVPTADVATNVNVRDVAGNKTDAAVTTVAADKSLMAYTKGLLNDNLALPRCVAKTDGAVLTGNDDLFTITGGPVRAKIVGVVTTIVGGASNGDLQIVTTTPAATFDLNAAPVAIDNDAAGTSYHNVGATSVFTPDTNGAVLLDPVTVEETEFILPIGTVHFRSSAAQTGVIAWYMTYTPLSPSSRVAAAA